MVGDKGLEPLREHMILSHARLPIPPIPHVDATYASISAPVKLRNSWPICGSIQGLTRLHSTKWRCLLFSSKNLGGHGDTREVRTLVTSLRGWLPSRLEDGTKSKNTISDNSLFNQSIILIKFIPINRIGATRKN